MDRDLREAVRLCLSDSAGDGATASRRWREAVGTHVRVPLAHVAAAHVDELAQRTGLFPTPGFLRALNRAVTDHLGALQEYGDLLDAVWFDSGQEGVDRALGEDRVDHVVETEARHMRSAVTVLLSALGGVDAGALVASGRTYVRDSIGRFAPVYGSGSEATALAAADVEGVAVLTDAPDLTAMSFEEVDAHISQLVAQATDIRTQQDELLTLDWRANPEAKAAYEDLDAQMDDLVIDHLRPARQYRADAFGPELDAIDPTHRPQQGPKVPERQVDPASRATHRAMIDDAFGADGPEAETRGALQQWQGNGYAQIQGRLYGGRQGPRHDADDVIDALDASMVPLPRGTTLYRGQTNFREFKVGDTISSTGYSATTVDATTATAFSRASGGVFGPAPVNSDHVVLRIRTTGAEMGLPVPNSGEMEVIMPRGSQYRITGFDEVQTNSGPLKVADVEVLG